MSQLKLYVWSEYSPDYTDGLAFAVAESEDQAKRLIAEAMGYVVDDEHHGVLIVWDLDTPAAYAVGGGG